jgi:hypothetical protein
MVIERSTEGAPLSDTPAPTTKRPPFRRVVVFVPLEQPQAA